MLAIRKCNTEHGVSTNMYSLIFRVRVTTSPQRERGDSSPLCLVRVSADVRGKLPLALPRIFIALP